MTQNSQKIHCYQIPVEHELMYPRFNKGDILTVDPNIKPKIGCHVIAKIIGKDESIFARYFINGEPNKIILAFTNPAFSMVFDSKSVAIVGVIISVLQEIFH